MKGDDEAIERIDAFYRDHVARNSPVEGQRGQQKTPNRGSDRESLALAGGAPSTGGESTVPDAVKPAAAPLDVAVLREAMHNEKWCKNEWLHERIHDTDDDTLRTLEELAAEYARLSEGTDR